MVISSENYDMVIMTVTLPNYLGRTQKYTINNVKGHGMVSIQVVYCQMDGEVVWISCCDIVVTKVNV